LMWGIVFTACIIFLLLRSQSPGHSHYGRELRLMVDELARWGTNKMTNARCVYLVLYYQFFI